MNLSILIDTEQQRKNVERMNMIVLLSQIIIIFLKEREATV